MKIFLDASDLINLLQGNESFSLNEFRELLRSGQHEIAINPTVALEIAAPLVKSSSKTVVTRLLNDLETLPLAYIAEGQISRKEYLSAIESFSAGKEYQAIDPYVARFEAAIPSHGPAPTALYLNHSLAETVFTIWQENPDLFHWPDELVNRLRLVMTADRNMPNPPSLAQHFREKLRRDLQLDKIPDSKTSLSELADWIYASHNRCPGGRLAYEVFHQLRKNVRDEPTASDFGDLVHVECIPYVDRITLDRRMADYVRRATRGWADDPGQKIRRNINSIAQEL